MLSKKLLIGALVATMSVTSFAHFQMIYTADSDISGKSSVPFELIFTHPADGVEAHNMDMGKDEIDIVATRAPISSFLDNIISLLNLFCFAKCYSLRL